MKTNAAIVLLSGGQDSTTVLAIALSECESVVGICFDYGQRHRIEIQNAKIIANLAAIPLHVLPLPGMDVGGDGNALTNSDIPIQTLPGELPSTFVPGRNLIFLTMGAIFAYSKKISVIYGGMCEADYSGYPDCRQAFITAAEHAISLALDVRIEIRTPLMQLTKADTVRRMSQLGRLAWYAHTHSCYMGVQPACGKCPACVLRLKGFAEAEISDPILYQ